MVSATAWILLGAIGLNESGPSLAPNPNAGDSQSVRSALEKGPYPWYDSKTDSTRPVLPRWEWDDWFKSSPRTSSRGWSWGGVGSAGDLVVIGLAMLGLSVLMVVLFELWRRYRPIDGEHAIKTAAGAWVPARIEGLPLGVRPETTDPWSEARRLRALGDFAGAIIALFAHQLLTLDRLRLIRLSPGRTARQLVGTIGDRPLRDSVVPALRLFEAVYYGHRQPSREEFEAVWELAEAFEGRVAEGVFA